jgi:hypothetical protein
MSDRPVALLIEDIWEATGKISRFTKGMTVDQFARDQKTTDAVVRNLEIIIVMNELLVIIYFTKIGRRGRIETKTNLRRGDR